MYIYIYMCIYIIHIYIYIYILQGGFIPPETWSCLTRNPPSLGFEPQTSCI